MGASTCTTSRRLIPPLSFLHHRQHRKLVVEALHDPSRELAFTGRVFDKDAKNYHTWVYRQWILARFGGLPPTADAGETSSSTPTPAQSAATPTHPSIWDGELIFVEERLRQDARNNSAWNHRYYCIFGSGHAQALGEEGGESTSSRRLCADVWRLGTSFDECVEHEIEYAAAVEGAERAGRTWESGRNTSLMLRSDLFYQVCEAADQDHSAQCERVEFSAGVSARRSGGVGVHSHGD